MEDLRCSPGATIDLKGAVVTCSLHHVPLDSVLDLSASGSVLRNGILRLPYGCTLNVKQATAVVFEDITLQMVDAQPRSESDSSAAAMVAAALRPLLQIQPGAELKVLRCRVSGSCGLGISVCSGAQLVGEDLWLEGCKTTAMEICGGSVDLTGCALKESGEGITCVTRARVTIRNLVAHGSNGRLLAASSGAEVRLHGVKLEGGDVALTAEDEACLECNGLMIVGCQGSAGVQLSGVGTSARFEASTFNQIGCSAVSVERGAVLEMTTCDLSECSSDEAVRGIESSSLLYAIGFLALDL